MLAGWNQVRNLIFFHNFIKFFLGSDLLPSQSDAVLKQRRKKKIAETRKQVQELIRQTQVRYILI